MSNDTNDILSLKIKEDGTIYDECGHTVTQENGTTPIVEIDGRQCMYFNNGNYLKVLTDENFNLTGDFTIEFWLKLDGTVINKTDRWPCVLCTKNTWSQETAAILVCTQDANNGIVLTDNNITEKRDYHNISNYNLPTQWNHVAFVCKDKKYYCYINGKLSNDIKNSLYSDGINLNVDGFIVVGVKGIDNSSVITQGTLHGYLSDLKINTSAKYTADYSINRVYGEQLLEPDPTWQRIDDRNVNFYYVGSDWVNFDSELSYNNGNHYYFVTDENKDNTYLEFYVYTNKLRIIGTYNTTEYNRSENNEIIIDNASYTFSCIGDYKTKVLLFEKLDLKKKIYHVIIKCNEVSKQLVFDAIDVDEDGYLLSREEYIKRSVYIKQNNKYYSFSKDNYDTTTKMYREITIDDINNDLYLCQLTDLTKEVTIGEETFKPIDKFDNFQFVSKYNYQKCIIGRKSKTGMSIASGDIYTKVTSRINSFTLDNTVNNNSYIKMAVSFDNGATWKTYKDKKFTDLSINIAIKTYENMTTDEKNNWKSAKETILSEGFTPDILSTIDFNTIENLNTIRFAYVLYQDLYTDTCNVDNLSWNFNAKGKFTKLKENEADISFSNGIISIEPTTNFDMILTNYTYNE